MSRQSISLRRKQTFQIIRYGIVGLSSNFAGYAVFLLITYFGVSYKLAMTLLYAVGVVIGFLGNKKWVFSCQGDIFRISFKYLLSHSLGYLLNLSILSIFVDKMGYSYRVVQAIAILAVGMLLFFLYKFFVFVNHPNHSQVLDNNKANKKKS
jgi:putative flippase GtrA